MKPGIPLDALNWYIMFFSLTIVWYVMRDISRRLGDALHMRKYYLLYDACEALLVVSIIILFTHFVLGINFIMGDTDLLPKTLKLVFLGAAIVQVAVTLKYWGWVVREVLAIGKK
jgi:hypothetical protein